MSLEDFAVIAGLDRYSDFQHLQGAGNDARRFHDWLVDPLGGGMHSHTANIFPVATPDVAAWDQTNPRPDARDLEAAFRTLHARAITGPRPIGARLFIFLAGHGFNDPNEVDEVALHSSDSKLAVPSYVAASWYAKEFRRIRAFEQIALITDCCRTSSVLHPISRPQATQIGADAQASLVKIFYAHATGFGTAAREHQNGGPVSGIFTQALLAALTDAPANQAGRLTGSSVKNFVHNNMATGQTADIRVDTNKEFVFVESHRSRIPPTGFLIMNHSGNELLVITDGSRSVVYEETPAAARVEVLLPPGLYKSEIKGSGRSRLIEIPSHEDIEI